MWFVRGVVRWGLIAIVGIAAPLALGWLTAAGQGQIAVGPWRTSLAVGSTDADGVTRTLVALTGLLALNSSETIYFTARTDDDGHRLSAACDYDLTGGPLGARWWSITAYADDNYLIPNAANRFSFNSKSLGSGPYTVALGPRERAGNWLPTGEHGGFTVSIRLYNPDPELAKAPDHATLPSITRVGACG
jgi:hypothetical protein